MRTIKFFFSERRNPDCISRMILLNSLTRGVLFFTIPTDCLEGGNEQ